MTFPPNILSHEKYFEIFPEERPHYFEYTSRRKDNDKYKTILHGFIKWNDEDASIWGGPFPGNYCLMHLFKNKSPLLPSIKQLDEAQTQDYLKYGWVEPKYSLYQASKEKPYKVYLMGNDDASYSKVFGTKTHAIRSINWLCNQPTNENLLNIQKYIFTN